MERYDIRIKQYKKCYLIYFNGTYHKVRIFISQMLLFTQINQKY